MSNVKSIITQHNARISRKNLPKKRGHRHVVAIVGTHAHYRKNRYAVAYMASTGSKTKNVNDVRFIFTFPTFEWGRLKYLGKYLSAL
jgi:hypothetical protein